MANVEQVIERLSAVSQANGGPAVTIADYDRWPYIDTRSENDTFHQALTVFLGEGAITEAQKALGCLPSLLVYALKMGPRHYCDIDLHRILLDHRSPALTYRQ